FFFQAEDGIRDRNVTGVQTCALPISQVDEMLTRLKVMGFDGRVVRDPSGLFKVRVGRYPTHDEAVKVQRRLKTRIGGQPFVVERSEERRVGKERRWRWCRCTHMEKG